MYLFWNNSVVSITNNHRSNMSSIKYSFKFFYEKIIGTTVAQCSRSMVAFNFMNNQRSDYKQIVPTNSRQYCTSKSLIDIQSPLDILTEDDEIEKLVPRSLWLGTMPHQVLIIHPHIKWGPKKKTDTSPNLQMEEAISLIRTLHDWKLVGTRKISLLSLDKDTLFNKGQLETVKTLVKENQLISSVFINIKSLKLAQHLFLEELFGIPVFDRYSIVMNIFKRHAITKEAKLQVSLAEIPYIRSRIKGINEAEGGNFIKNTGIGSGETFLTKRLKALSFHEQQIRKSIEKLRKTRELLRKKRKSLELPVVAVVGYTNAGKTSLIKCLTEEEQMKPEDKLFATLDVTVHAGILPCNLKVLYVDTIGFITDLPTNLLEPFVATLEDAIQADLIIHVQDISHPDHFMQKFQVLKTLESLNLKSNIMENIISVGNKHDKIPSADNNELVLVSCLKQTGLSYLEQRIEKGIIDALQLQKIRIRVKNGGREYYWLQKEVAISNYIIDDKDQQYIFLDVVISKANLEKFKSYFIRR